MRVDAFEPDRRLIAQSLKCRFPLRRKKAEAAKSRVDFEKCIDRYPRMDERVKAFEALDRDRQAQCSDLRRVLRQGRRKEQDLVIDPSVSDRKPLFRAAHAKSVDASPRRQRRNTRRAEAESVALAHE